MCENKKSLLSSYEIPIQHLDFHYVEKCENAFEVEKILRVLRSGEEGFYPELTKATEERLAVLQPNSKLLRVFTTPVLNKHDLNNETLQDLTQDLNNFLTNISKSHKELASRKCNASYNNATQVRQVVATAPAAKFVQNRIKSTDYSAWDKYDPDTELLKIDLDEERLRKEARTAAKKQANLEQPRIVGHFATKTEAEFIANHEREKGDEFFKTADYQPALIYYTNSITAKRTVSNLNKRMATLTKLQRYDEALEDCNAVLEIDPMDFAANFGKAYNFEQFKNYKRALFFAERAIKIDPNRIDVQELADRVGRFCVEENKINNSHRMKIVEID